MAFQEIGENDDIEALAKQHEARKNGVQSGQDDLELDQDPEGTAVELEEDDLEIVDDTPEEDRGRKYVSENVDDPTDDEMNEYGAKVQKRLKELTRARHDERRRADALAREKAELERVARTFAEQQRKLQEYIAMGQTAYIDKAKQAATLATEAARAKLKDAYDRGDSDAIASAQEALTSAQLQLQEANNFRVAPLPTHEEPAYTTPQEPQQPETTAPQVDEMTRAWVANNPWFQKDQRMTRYAMSVHADLVAKYGPEYTRTQEYFDDIDSEMRKVFPEQLNVAQGAPATKRRPAPVVASAQRATSGKKKIRLTQTQVNIANQLGVPLEVYAKQLAALENNNG